MTPTQPYRAWRALVGSAVIAAVAGVWVHSYLGGRQLGTLWSVVMVALVVASGYAVFGRRTMERAVEDAQELADGSQEDDDGDA